MTLFGGADVPLECQADVLVAGVPVRVASNSPRVTVMTARRFAPLPTPTPPECRLTLVVRDGGDPESDWSNQQWCFPDSDRAVVSGPGLSAAIDLAAGDAVAVVDDAFVEAHGSAFMRLVLEAFVYTLLIRRDRHPVHAATLYVGDAALLLHGPSGVGKSTTRRGFSCSRHFTSGVTGPCLAFTCWSRPGRNSPSCERMVPSVCQATAFASSRSNCRPQRRNDLQRRAGRGCVSSPATMARW
jgi:hypothetical protein